MLYSVNCSGDSKDLTELGSNKIEVIVLDDQKSRELSQAITLFQSELTGFHIAVT